MNIKVKVPASIANIGPGFDVLGFAINEGITVNASPGDNNNGSQISLREADRDMLWESIRYVCKKHNRETPKLKIKQDLGKIRLKKGLGSSGAAIVAGVLIARKINNMNTDPDVVAVEAAEIEGHPDNAVPSSVGGLTLCFNTEKGLKFIRGEMDPELKVVVGVPDIEVDTDKARKILPKKIKLNDAVFNNSRTALLIWSLIKRDYKNLALAMQDRVHQKYRKKFIPGFDEIIKETLKNGAYGTAVSGSGPCVFSFCDSQKDERIGEVMKNIWDSQGVESYYFITEVCNKGVEIIE
ncbi:MAG: homoserine kinase [Elusimicrobiota bacterium]